MVTFSTIIVLTFSAITVLTFSAIRDTKEAKQGLAELYETLNPAALRRRLQAAKRDLNHELMVPFLSEATN